MYNLEIMMVSSEWCIVSHQETDSETESSHFWQPFLHDTQLL